MKFFPITLVALCAAATSLFADQFAYIKPDVAKRAETILRTESQVYLFCEPCDEVRGQVEKITKVETADVKYEGNHEVRINGKGIDLAYVFVRRGDKWKNLAVMMDLKPVRVSAELPVNGPDKPAVKY